MIARILAAAVFTLTVLTAAAKPILEQIGEFSIPEANQAVGVDDKYFYALDNQAGVAVRGQHVGDLDRAHSAHSAARS